MTEHKLDITGKICPYCLLIVKKELKKLPSGDIIIVKTDHPPAATDTIPYNMKKEGNPIETRKLESGVWELTITKK
ncbi:MAG: sulfurtransferase TusA family protein [Candidatus Hermodarchaeota archaeon]